MVILEAHIIICQEKFEHYIISYICTPLLIIAFKTLTSQSSEVSAVATHGFNDENSAFGTLRYRQLLLVKIGLIIMRRLVYLYLVTYLNINEKKSQLDQLCKSYQCRDLA